MNSVLLAAAGDSTFTSLMGTVEGNIMFFSHVNTTTSLCYYVNMLLLLLWCWLSLSLESMELLEKLLWCWLSLLLLLWCWLSLESIESLE